METIGPTPKRRSTDNQRMLRFGEIVFSRDDPTDYLHNTNWEALKSHTQATLNGVSKSEQ